MNKALTQKPPRNWTPMLVCLLVLQPVIFGAIWKIKAPDQSPEHSQQKTPEKPLDKSLSKKDRKVKFWMHPMDPSITSKHPMKDNMGMDFTPVYEGEEDGYIGPGLIGVNLDPAQVQKIGVRTATVQRSALSQLVRATGTVTYDEDKLTLVSSKLSGYVDALNVKRTAAFIRKGQALYEIYSPELAATYLELRLAQKSLHPEMVQAALARLKVKGAGPGNLRFLGGETGRPRLGMKSPVSGMVLERMVTEGEFVNEGQTLFKIADLSSVWIEIQAQEKDGSLLKIGQDASVELAALPGESISGKVDFIYPYLTEESRNIKARLRFPNPQGILKPGMYGTVSIDAGDGASALWAPTEAVLHNGPTEMVFVVLGQGRFVRRTVTTGPEDGAGNIQILSGLKDGEHIVLSGQFLLDSEARVKETIHRMQSEKQKSGAP